MKAIDLLTYEKLRLKRFVEERSNIHNTECFKQILDRSVEEIKELENAIKTLKEQNK